MYCFTSVHFGDRPAAVLMEEARRLAMVQGEAIDPELTKRMEQGGYVDDNICGGTSTEMDRMIGSVSEEEGEYRYTGTISQVFAEVGMMPKVNVRVVRRILGLSRS